jgi:hypothetical protein
MGYPGRQQNPVLCLCLPNNRSLYWSMQSQLSSASYFSKDKKDHRSSIKNSKTLHKSTSAMHRTVRTKAHEPSGPRNPDPTGACPVAAAAGHRLRPVSRPGSSPPAAFHSPGQSTNPSLHLPGSRRYNQSNPPSLPFHLLSPSQIPTPRCRPRAIAKPQFPFLPTAPCFSPPPALPPLTPPPSAPAAVVALVVVCAAAAELFD